MIIVKEAVDFKNLFEGAEVISLDIETTGLCPFLNEIRLIQLSDGENTMVIDMFSVERAEAIKFLKPLLESKDVVKVLHNAKFDLKFLWSKLGIRVERIFDSYLTSTILSAGIRQAKGFHGLEAVVKRYLDLDLDKSQQTSDWSGELSEEQLLYAAKDVEVLIPLRKAMIPYLKKFKLTRCAKLEFNAVLPTVWLELSGIYLDIDEWLLVADRHLTQAEEYANKIYAKLDPVLPQGSLFGEPKVNLNSHTQIRKYFTEIGVPIPDSTREFLLKPLTKDYPIVDWLLEYRGHIKAHGTFGEPYKKFINPITNRIHADFAQSVAETGRYAVSNPNLNQIPSDDAHRACFKAESGNSIISCDFSQEELRILADVSRDEKFKALFESGQDFHTMTASTIFNIPLDRVGKEERDLAKRCNFGITYCIGPAKLALNANILELEAQTLINTYFQTFPGVKRWIDFQKQQVLRTHYSRSVGGRLMRYEFDDADGKSRSQAQRNAVNGPIQATGADILKRALRLFYDAIAEMETEYEDILTRVKLINVVHDEINVEAPDDLIDVVKDKLITSMQEAGKEFVKTVDIKVDCKISKVWKK